jgi:Protein of unknown function (DUF3035)
MSFMTIVPARLFPPLGLLACCIALAGCGGIGRALGVAKSSPDEFSVVTKAPLVIPPDYTLKPPAPGVQSPQTDTTAEAQAALLGGTTSDSTSDAASNAPPLPSTMSDGERALVIAAGAEYADPLIRQVVDQEYAGLTDKGPSLSDRLIFWDHPVSSVDTAINPEAEAQRLDTQGNSPKTTERVSTPTAPPSGATVPGQLPAVPDQIEGQKPPIIGDKAKSHKGLLRSLL